MSGSARFVPRLALVSAAAAVIRIVAAFSMRWHQGTGVTDEFGYLGSAHLLADGRGFINPFSFHNQHIEVASAIHPPVYSMVLAVPAFLGLDRVFAFRLFNAGIGVVLVFAIGLLAHELAGERAGLLAAGLAAIYPALWISDTAIMPESLFCLFVVLGLLAAYRFRTHPTWPLLAATAGAFSLAAMTRSEGVLLLPVIAIPLALLTPGADAATRVRFAGVVCIVAALLIGPWIVRNMLTFDEPTTMATGAGHVLAYGNCDATYHGRFLGYWNDSCALKVWPAGDESVVNEAAQKKGVDYMKDHAGRLPVVVAARVGRLFEVYRPAQSIEFDRFFERRGLWPSRLALAGYYLLLVPAAYGLVVLRRRGRMIWPLLGVTGIVVFTAATTFGVTRYRASFDALLPVVAAVGIVGWFERRTPEVDATAPPADERDHVPARPTPEVAVPAER